MLQIEGLHVRFGKSEILRGLDLEVGAGAIVALLGPNGSGKSTTLRAVAGLVRGSSGRILVNGHDITSTSAASRVRAGVTLVPQGRRLFRGMTVRENLSLGAYLRSDRREVAAEVNRWLDFFPVLRERADRTVETLSGGQQQMVAVARGLMARPRLLMLDEPSIGVAPVVLDEIVRTIGHLRESGVTILLVEQNVPFALRVADWVAVLGGGQVILREKPEALADRTRLAEVYFGRPSGPPAKP